LPFYHQRIWTETKSDETARPKIATGGSIEGALLASLVANANWTCLISVASVIKKANSLETERLMLARETKERVISGKG
jgi:hypothetical protein